MNYLLAYNRIILFRQRNPLEGYTEEHHILPKCLFPEFKNLRHNPWNGVKLSAREHFIVHQLLVKIYPSNYKLCVAAQQMSNYREFSSRKYNWLKQKRKDEGWVSTECIEKRVKSRKGYTHSEETKRKISEANKGKVSKLRGRKLSEEVKNKISETEKGKVVSEETRQKLSDFNKGKIVSEETKQKISNFHKGRQRSEETKKRISEAKKGKPSPLKGRKRKIE